MPSVRLDKSIEFRPPMWGGDVQRIKAGGYLLRDRKNRNDIYGIGVSIHIDNDVYDWLRQVDSNHHQPLQKAFTVLETAGLTIIPWRTG